MQTEDYCTPDIVAGTVSVPVLTVIYHRDLARVGERALLADLASGQVVKVSRDAPVFAHPGHLEGSPLGDPSISRTPFTLEPGPGGGVRLRRGEHPTKLTVRGEVVDREVDLGPADLAQGVVLRVGGASVLLVHRMTAGFVERGESLGLTGESEAIEKVRREIRRVADLDVPVLLRGETGTGKELVARAIHEAGARRAGPFVAVNLGAVAPELLASELFGAERGSFTGAVRHQEGYFGAARRGTLFLDEVGEAPLALQSALLRALETGEVQRVGAARPQKIDVRVVAATDADLEQMVKQGAFRAPLVHRLSASEIWVPPLRDRRDDIGRLLLQFLREELARAGEEHRLAPSDRPWLSPTLVARLAELDWPGNVRQLRNVARQLAIGAKEGDRAEIGPSLARLLSEPPPPVRSTPPGAEPATGSLSTPSLPVPIPEAQRGALDAQARPTPEIAPRDPAEPADRRKPSEVTDEELLAALRASRWELAPAATALRVSRASLYVLVENHPGLRTAGSLTPAEIRASHDRHGGDVARMVDELEVSEKALRRRMREIGLPLKER